MGFFGRIRDRFRSIARRVVEIFRPREDEEELELEDEEYSGGSIIEEAETETDYAEAKIEAAEAELLSKIEEIDEIFEEELSDTFPEEAGEPLEPDEPAIDIEDLDDLDIFEIADELADALDLDPADLATLTDEELFIVDAQSERVDEFELDERLAQLREEKYDVLGEFDSLEDALDTFEDFGRRQLILIVATDDGDVFIVLKGRTP
jgi:hypothetical protein